MPCGEKLERACSRITSLPDFVVNFSTEEIYIPNECQGSQPAACPPGVRYNKNALACLHGLANRDPEQQRQCPLTIYKTTPQPSSDPSVK